ncbi:ABC-type transport system permease protein (probable substrate sugar) [Halobacterium hubeiense]|uniref:ABC-type transport system permease protein (Probable substrate sugar) n=1 Tax=Halobacterium hubeiense TaxID=1407499 RepID=A0A0U5H1V3_9EURY|nr:ABC transporter permease [Halobacterium hubeiense]CQH53816.1 ABC-type transport system permease protein (probable substrate sugar) [Halobacterium hubeiense]
MSAADRARDLLGRLVRASAFERFLISISALLLSVFIGALIILGAGRMTDCSSAAYTIAVPGKFVTQFVGGSSVFAMGFCYDPFAVYDLLFLGALGDVLSNPLNGQFATTLAETTILMFTGVAVAVAFRADIFNIGVQGQLVVGALTTGVVLAYVAPPLADLGVLATVVLLPLGLLLGGVAGGAYAAVPGALKAYADANEVITTIMLNFVATSVALFLVSREKYFKDPESFANQTVPLPDVAMFPDFLFRPRDDVSLLALAFAIAVLVGIWYLLQHTSFGYDLRTSGLQPDAAEYGGVDADRTIVSSITLSGALAGIGGAVYVLMMLGNFQTGVPDYGFDGITVSILAGNNPLGVGFAALLFGVLKSGSVVVQVGSDVPPTLVGVLRGLIILFVAMPEFFRMIGRKFGSFDQPGEPVAADGATGGGSDE